MTTIKITVNGESMQIADQSRVIDLIGELKLVPERVAVELNLSILPRSQWAEWILQPGDKLEIVHFVGGGKD